MINVFAKPEEIQYEEIKYGFRDGAVLIYDYPSCRPGYADVYAILDVDVSDTDIEETFQVIEKRFHDIIDIGTLMIARLSRVTPTRIQYKDPDTYDRSEFWLDSEYDMQHNFDRIKKIFHVSDNELYLFYSIDDKKDEITYFGYSTQNASPDFMVSKVKGDVKSCSYKDFLRFNREAHREEKRKAEEAMKRAIFEEDSEEDDWLYMEEAEFKDIRNCIRGYLHKETFADMLDYVQTRVKGQPELPKVLAGIYHYLQCVAEKRPCNSNILLAAPSGCGKTETFRALHDYFHDKLPEFPILQVDMTSITEEGFKGPDTVDIVRGLFHTADPTGIGIVFMDEFDKKLIPSFTSGGNNVNAAVQAQILTLIEGRNVTYKEQEINTANTLFIGLGSYDVCRQRREEVHGGLGFGAVAQAEQTDHYHPINRQDMIEMGASYELLGRFQIIANYYRLPKKMVNEIIDEHVKKLELSIGYSIRITAALREQLWEQANGNYGCRMLENTLVDATMQILAKLFIENPDKKSSIVVLDRGGQARIEKKRIRMHASAGGETAAIA